MFSAILSTLAALLTWWFPSDVSVRNKADATMISAVFCFGLTMMTWVWATGRCLARRTKSNSTTRSLECFFDSALVLVFVVSALIYSSAVIGWEVTGPLLTNWGAHILLAAFMISVLMHVIAAVLLVRAEKWLHLDKFYQGSRYFKTFVLMWFSPFGIWFIQPRVEHVLERASRTQCEQVNSA